MQIRYWTKFDILLMINNRILVLQTKKEKYVRQIVFFITSRISSIHILIKTLRPFAAAALIINDIGSLSLPRRAFPLFQIQQGVLPALGIKA